MCAFSLSLSVTLSGLGPQLKLAEMLDTLPDLDDNIGSALQTFEEQSQRPILFCVQYY